MDNSGKFSFHDRLKSFGYAFSGIINVLKKQHNFRIHVVIAIAVIIAGFWFEISIAEWLFLIFAIGFVLSAEMFNSAIEVLVDMISPGFDEKAGLAKDIAAGAVLVAAVTAAVIGLLIFIPYILKVL